MKIWKVIVATALIFISGYSAGFFVGIKSRAEGAPQSSVRPSTPPWERRGGADREGEPGRPPRPGGGRESREDRFINGAMHGIREKVGVTDEEAATIRQILVTHQKEMRDRWAREISPIIDEEMAVVDQRILKALPTEEKRAAYQELMEERERRSREGFRGAPPKGGPRPDTPQGPDGPPEERTVPEGAKAPDSERDQ